jgi:hypothetical protein
MDAGIAQNVRAGLQTLPRFVNQLQITVFCHCQGVGVNA